MLSHNKLFLLRVVFSIAVIVSVAWGSWLYTVAISILGLFFIKRYYEIIIWGVIIDALYGVSGTPMYTLVAGALLITSIIIRERVRDTMYI